MDSRVAFGVSCIGNNKPCKPALSVGIKLRVVLGISCVGVDELRPWGARLDVGPCQVPVGEGREQSEVLLATGTGGEEEPNKAHQGVAEATHGCCTRDVDSNLIKFNDFESI
jgi:hypothetical protein